MSTAAVETPPREAFQLNESATVSLVEGGLQPDGTVLMHIIRPGEGKGRGSHYYSRDMLRENAHVFTGWKMFVDHLAPEARKAAGGLPRSIRDLGGVVLESWWDDSVPGDSRHEQGAVVGRARPIGVVRALVEEAPELVEASISATATGVKPVSQGGGKRVWAVEGIEPKGSVDWVTEAGAGGRLIPLMEAMIEDEDGTFLESLVMLQDDELHAYLSEERPALVEALVEEAKKKGSKPDSEPKGDNDSDEGDEANDNDNDAEDQLEKMIEELLPKFNGNKALATQAAKKKLAAKKNVNEGGEVAELTPEALREALTTDEGRVVLADLVRAEVEQGIEPLVEARVSEVLETEREIMGRQAQARADRQILLRDLQILAERQIDEAKLPEKFAEQSKAKFTLTEAGPTPGLNVIPEITDDGEVERSEREILTEAVAAEITAQRELAASVNRTRVRGQGSSTVARKSDEEGGEEVKRMAQDAPLANQLLTEAGFDDPDKVYATIES